MAEVGEILEGKVTSIMKYGAFIALENGGSGLVHISEIANTFVQDVREHLTEGQAVKVKVIGIDENKRIRLSVKKAQPEPTPAPSAAFTPPTGVRPAYRPAPRPMSMPARPAPPPVPAAPPVPGEETLPPTGDTQFEDRLKSFLQDSNSRMSDLKHQADRKSGSYRRPRNRG